MSRSQGHKPWCHFKGVYEQNIHAKYEGSISYGSKVVANVKVSFNTDKQTVTDRQAKIYTCNCPQFYSWGMKNLIHVTDINFGNLLQQWCPIYTQLSNTTVMHNNGLLPINNWKLPPKQQSSNSIINIKLISHMARSRSFIVTRIMPTKSECSALKEDWWIDTVYSFEFAQSYFRPIGIWNWFAHSPIFLHNPLCIIQFAQFWICPQVRGQKVRK